jgi:hypothetical protein
VLPRAAARPAWLLLLALVLISLQPAQAAASAPSHAARPPAAVAGAAPVAANPGWNTFGLTKEVFGYATAGSLGDPTFGYTSWNFNLLATVAFFAIRVNNLGVLVADSDYTVWSSPTLTNLVSTAHAHGTKVVVTIRAGGADLCGALYGYQTTVLQIAKEVKAKGVDGVNIDYEGQLATCTNPNGGTNYTNQALVTQLAAALRAALPGYYLSIATYSGSAAGNDGFFNIPDLNQYVDSFFVMAYDMDYSNQGLAPLDTCTRFCMAPVSPLTNYYWNDTTSMNQYVAVTGASKVILGQPYYGRVSCVSSAVAHATATTTVQAATYIDAAAAISSTDVQPGTYAVHRDANDPTGADRWDTWYDNAYHCWREMYWSDVTTLSTRYDLVNQLNLRGVGFWTLNYGGGSAELWSSIQTHFVACSNVTLTPTPASPSLSSTTVQLTAAAAACVSPRYAFWMRPPNGAWSLVRPYSTNPSLTWSTAGLLPGDYHFSVWAQDTNSHGLFGSGGYTYDSYVAADYTLTVAPCTSLSATLSQPSAMVGETVTVTGAAAGCPQPSYEFWIQPPGGAWSVAQAYSTNANFVWKTAARGPGVYHLSIWARDSSSRGTGGTPPNTYDAFAGLPYTLTMPSCATLSATATPATSASVGTPVSVTAATSGCPNPVYRFWLLSPGGAWTSVQYSTSPTLNWSTTSRAAGTYRFSVWVRDGASPNAYDSFSAFDYTLTVQPCTANAASEVPASTTTSGTTVTVTGAATGCPNPQYEFWLRAPGSSWVLVQSYSGKATYTWVTAGLPTGSYRFSVWARDISSSSPYDTFDAFDYGLT